MIRAALVLLLLPTGCDELFDDKDWNSGRVQDFQYCRCTYFVDGAVDEETSGDLSMFSINGRGDRQPYAGGETSLLLDCAPEAREASNKGLAISIDTFVGPGTYGLSENPIQNPSKLEYYPANLSRIPFIPVEGSGCTVDIHLGRSGEFDCPEMFTRDGQNVSVRGWFSCE